MYHNQGTTSKNCDHSNPITRITEPKEQEHTRYKRLDCQAGREGQSSVSQEKFTSEAEEAMALDTCASQPLVPLPVDDEERQTTCLLVSSLLHKLFTLNESHKNDLYSPCCHSTKSDHAVVVSLWLSTSTKI